MKLLYLLKSQSQEIAKSTFEGVPSEFYFHHICY